MCELKINGINIECVEVSGCKYYNMAKMYSASGVSGQGARPGRVIKQKSSDLSLLLEQSPDSFINDSIGSKGNDLNWCNREMAVLYTKYLGVHEQVKDLIGDFELLEFETLTIDGVEVRVDDDLYCLNDIVNGNNLTRSTMSNFISCRNGPGFRYISKHGKDGNYKRRKLRDGTWTHWVNSDLVVMIYEKRIPGSYNKVKSMLGEYQDDARREFVFGRDIVFNMFSEYKIFSQYPVFNGKYRIDWYVPELKIAIEFDESHHFDKHSIERDEIRQREIEKELGCRFLRYTDK